MDTSEVEKFFAVWPKDVQTKGETQEVRAEYKLLIIKCFTHQDSNISLKSKRNNKTDPEPGLEQPSPA